MKPALAVILILALPVLSSCGSSGTSSSSLPASVRMYGVSSCSSNPVAAYSQYNVLVFGNFSAPSSDTQGILAAGGNVTLANYSVGDRLPSGFCSPALIAGGSLDFTSGNVVNGSAVYGGNASLTSQATAAGGFHRDPRALDFSQAWGALQSYSDFLAGLAPDGAVQLQSDTNRFAITLTGSDPYVNLFQLTSDELGRADSLTISVPRGATAVINVTGTCVTLANFAFQLNGTDPRHVLLNMPDVTSLSIADIEVDGTILAPRADVTFASGDVDGSLFARSMTGAGEFDLDPFQGFLPVQGQSS